MNRETSRKAFAGILVFLLVFVFTSNQDLIAVNAEQSQITTYSAPTDLPSKNRSTDFSINVNGKNIDIYKSGLNAWGNDVSFGSFDFSGEVTVKLTVNFNFSSFKLIPDSLGLKGSREGNTITFTLDKPQNITLVLDGNYQGKVLHLFAQAPEINIPSPLDKNIVYFGPGYYDLSAENPIMLNEGQTLYIAGGAVVKGRVLVKDTTNVTIRGKGILLNDYQSNDEYDSVPLVLKRSSNVNIYDLIITRDIGSWNAFMWRCSDINVGNIKVVNAKYASSDGFDISNSHDVTFDSVFIHSCDDSVAIKGTGNNGYNPNDDPSKADPTYNIVYKNSQLWSDANNAIGIGAETDAGYFDNINFYNIDILNNYDDLNYPDQLTDRSAINICALNATNIQNVTFDNIRVGKAKRLIAINMVDDFWFGSLKGNWSWPGTISDIHYKNITSTSDGTNEIRIYGRDAQHTISNVTFENVNVNGQYLNNFSNPLLHINKFAGDIKISSPDLAVPMVADGPIGIPHTAADEFSNVQGENNWYYRSWAAGIGTADMRWNPDNSEHWRGPNTWDAIWKYGSFIYLHPDNNQAMLEWKSQSSVNITITGSVKKASVGGGDGVSVSIWKNNAMIWPENGEWQTIEYNDSVGKSHNITTNVALGDVISFRVDQRGNSAYDMTCWNPSISDSNIR